jgi:alanyl-tRNA synthetase/misacylated tRNA(Ala) deacylase
MQTRPLFEHAPYETTFIATALEVSDLGVALDQTLFYPTGGGQPGDTGSLTMPDGTTVRVMGTLRDPLRRSVVWHQVEGSEICFSPGMALRGDIDAARRYQHMRMHTCLHLLCSMVAAPVTGCSIGHEKGRLDFDLPDMTLDKAVITARLNELVEAGLEVRSYRTTVAQTEAALQMSRTQGAAPPTLNGEVQMIEIVGVDVQPCGGTHVRNTKEVGRVVCEKIEKKSAHNRRVSIRFA